jgi:hypothetical protein
MTGMTGYHLGRDWPPTWYLDHARYEWLDPAFAGDLWEGEIGVAVYVPILAPPRRPGRSDRGGLP